MKLTPQDVARHYDEWTPKYVAAFGPCIQAHRPTNDDEFLDYVMHRIGLGPGLRVLDAGCGICGPARFFATRSGANIDAVTISSVQGQLAREANELARLADRIHVKVGDFHNLVDLYGTAVFDRVYFLESLSHSAEPARVLHSAYRVLKPGGAIYIKDFFIRPCESTSAQQQVLDVVTRVNRAFQVETAWAADIVKHLTGAGFVQVFVQHPQFAPDISRWQAFENANQFQLYENDLPVHWTEWLEFKFVKPAD